ncbi:hypothetical protein BH09BAC2_BH09BAC2_14820 [soil metagenome]
MSYADKLNTMWDSADYSQKQQLQNLLFPDGMYYSRKKDGCRTERVNAVFLCMSQLASILKENKNGENGSETNFPVLVELQGVEPWSKHIRHKLSTCLFLHYLSGKGRGKTNQPYP